MDSIKTCVLAIFVCLMWTVSDSRFAQAGGGPENLVLVVNAESAASLSVANEYILLRKIPAQNVIYLSGIIDSERWDLASFKDKILGPVFETMKERKLFHIDYIVYSSDFPTEITIEKDVAKYLDLAKVPASARKLFRASASISSLTYFARHVLAESPSYIALNANSYMRDGSAKLLIEPFVGPEQAIFHQARSDYQAAKYTEAEAAFKSLAEKHPRQVAVQYWLARTIAKQGDMKKTMDQLSKCIQVGWSYQKMTREDEAFVEWKDSPEFRSLVDQIPDMDSLYLPTTHFRASDIWGPNGMRNGDPSQGARFYLSTVLAVTRNRGITEAEAITNLRNSVSADFTHPTGTFYFSVTKDVRSTTRAMHFDRVIEELKQAGFNAETITTPLPNGKQDVLGLTLGAAGYRIQKADMKILPGAIVENLTSYGGAMKLGAKQTPLTHCLNFGAAGSSGTVTEPYSIIAKFPHPRIHLHYSRGCSLAEAFYQSVHGPFMLLIVGDALCQPFARQTDFEVEGLSATQEYSGQVSFDLKIPSANESQPLKIAGFEIFLDGVLRSRIPPGQSISFDSKTLSDGFHEIRIVAIANNEMRWQTSKSIAMNINNEGAKVSLETIGVASRRNDQQFELKFESSLGTVGSDDKSTEDSSKSNEKSEEAAMAIFQNQRILATMKDSAGTIKIDARSIGRGKTQLYAARKVNSKWVFSSPVDIEVTY